MKRLESVVGIPQFNSFSTRQKDYEIMRSLRQSSASDTMLREIYRSEGSKLEYLCKAKSEKQSNDDMKPPNMDEPSLQAARQANHLAAVHPVSLLTQNSTPTHTKECLLHRNDAPVQCSQVSSSYAKTQTKSIRPRGQSISVYGVYLQRSSNPPVPM